MRKHSLFVIVPLLAFSSNLSSGCAPRAFEDAEALYAFVNSEEYAAVVHEERGGFRFTARYLPPDAMMVNHYRAYEEQCERVIADRSLSELDRTRSLNRLRREVERVRSGYEETWSFQLTIEPLNGRDLVYEFEGAALI